MSDDWMPDLPTDLSRVRSSSVVQRWHLPKSNQVLVYFIAAEGVEDGPVKIGISAHPTARLAEMQQHNPTRLEILALCAGGAKRERQYHERFAEHRLHGEWFSRSEPLDTLIRWHKARDPLRAEVDDHAK